MKSRVHVIGAGLSGLAAAVRLSAAGCQVIVSEAASQAGGRCRSYHDSTLDAVIDNGNHLVLSGNPAVQAYLEEIGASGHLTGSAHAEFPFYDMTSRIRWTLRPNDGRLPWWVLSSKRRVPGTRAKDYLRYSGLATTDAGTKIEDCIPTHGVLWDRFLEPVLVSILNTPPETASAQLTWAVIRETLLKGGKSYVPRIASPSLAETFIDPALDLLSSRGVDIRLGRRLKTIHRSGGRVTALSFADGEEILKGDDKVILAVPAWVAKSLIPEITAPDDFRPIANIHFKALAPAGTPPILGVTGGMAHWIFTFPGRISVTVSAAEDLMALPREELAARIWADVAEALHMSGEVPPWQIVREKRATFAATPEQAAKRPEAVTQWDNLFLAGDWTDTGLPATIEGALRSGGTAAHLALKKNKLRR